MRWICSASGTVSAAAGIGRAPAPKVCTPVWGVRGWSVPIERTTIAIAPLRLAMVGPRRRGLGAGEALADLGGEAFEQVPGNRVALQRRIAQGGGSIGDGLGGCKGGKRGGEKDQLFHDVGA